MSMSNQYPHVKIDNADTGHCQCIGVVKWMWPMGSHRQSSTRRGELIWGINCIRDDSHWHCHCTTCGKNWVWDYDEPDDDKLED